MFSQYFGHYLLNHAVITNEQLQKALELQQSVHVKFGVIAVDLGMMTSAQVDEVHEKQKQMDKRFGEIAIELGYLTDAQVDTLISHQKQSHLYLAQALVDLEIMTMDEFSQALHDYKKAHSLSDEQFEAIRNGDIDTLIDNAFSQADAEVRDAYSKYAALFAKNMIRFIDDQAYIEVQQHAEVNEGNWLVYQEILGEQPLWTALNLPEDVLLHIASVYAEEEIPEVDELAQDAISEFLNLHNGIYLVNMSNWGIELSMSPQQVVKPQQLAGDIFAITVHTSKGAFQLLLSKSPANITIQESEQGVTAI